MPRSERCYDSKNEQDQCKDDVYDYRLILILIELHDSRWILFCSNNFSIRLSIALRIEGLDYQPEMMFALLYYVLVEVIHCNPEFLSDSFYI